MNNLFKRNNYIKYLNKFEGVLFKSKIIEGVQYYAYGLRYINKSNTLLLQEDSVVCIAMNYSSDYINNNSNIVLNIIPKTLLLNGNFKLYDYKIPSNNSIYMYNTEEDIVKDQYKTRLISGVGYNYKDLSNILIKENGNKIYYDLFYNRYNILKLESYNEIYCIDCDNPSLVLFSNLNNVQCGRVSFSKVLNLSLDNSQYIYTIYKDNYQNNLLNTGFNNNKFNPDEYNKQMFNYINNI